MTLQPSQPFEENNLTFFFFKNWQVSKFDQWEYLRSYQKIVTGIKAVDFIAMCSKDKILWLIEVKDYRYQAEQLPSDLIDAIGRKLNGTLACLASARLKAKPVEKELATAAMQREQIKVVLHLEQPRARTQLTPRPISEPNLLKSMKSRFQAIDNKPQIMSMNTMKNAPWTVKEKAQC